LDWRAEEEVAALYAVRKSILEAYSKHTESQGTRGDLVAALNQINLFSLSQRIERPRLQMDGDAVIEVGKHRGKVVVPLVRRQSILVNGAKSSFADIMAPFMLMQSKDSSKGERKYFELENELRKCCLLKDCTDDRAIRGLLAVWRGDCEVGINKPPDNRGATHVGDADRDKQGSEAFPENLVKYREPIDLVPYASIESNSCSFTVRGKSKELPQFEPSDTIAYLIVTSADTLRVRVGSSHFITVDEGMLTANMELDLSKVHRDDLLQGWQDIMDKCRKGLQIHFLFTRSSDVGLGG
jgi:hypothetical protein